MLNKNLQNIPMDEKNSPAGGTQSAAKVLALLRHVGAHHASGIRLRDLIALTGQDRSTAHRLLACLVKEGFVERIDSTKLYRLGIEALQWSLSSAGLAPVVERFRPVMQRLARQTGDTVFLVVRSGDQALCLHREEGPFPIKAFIVETGMRRPLAISAVGAAILSQLPEHEVRELYARNTHDYELAGMSLERMLAILDRTRRAGFSTMTDFRMDETCGVGCAFRLSRNSFAGVSIAAIKSRMPDKRMAELGAQLVREVAPLAWRPDADD